MKTSCRKFASFSTRLIIVVLFFVCLINAHASLCRQVYAGWVTGFVDSVGDVGWFPSLAFNPISGYPAIAYEDATNFNSIEKNIDLKFAHFDGTDWNIRTLDSQTYQDHILSSLAFDASGYPAISYSRGGRALNFTYFNGFAWNRTSLGSGSENSLAFDPSGYPAISYTSWDGTNSHSKYAHFNGSTWDITIIDSTGGGVSLAFDPSGYPAISYSSRDGTLNYAHFNGSTWDIIPVDSMGSSGSLAFDPSGYPALYHIPLGMVLTATASMPTLTVQHGT